MNEKLKKSHAFWRMCLTALIWMLASTLYAQNITVKGTVKDPTGEPVIGASVTVQGTRTGTVTNIDGNYSIECSPQSTLVFSYLGFKAKSVAVNGRQQVDVDFEDDATALNEVVVTALGIKRQTKALGYAVTELKSDELERANTVSPVTALQGKVAGVEISQSDGGMFGSTKIQIRGASTLNANNQPIFVVDGVILDNATSRSGDADWNSDINDYGNQLKNLNPDDFESVSVLKGAAATALYGSRGLNGAVVITTKSGKAGKGVSVRFSQTVGLETVYRSPDLQNKYLVGAFPGGVGYDEYYTKTGNTWGDNMSSFARNSKGDYSFIEQYDNGLAWGPEISWAEGKQFEQYDGTMGPARIFKNNYKDAYDTGFNTNTNISLQGGNDRTQFYASASYKYNKGTTPRNTFNRFSFLGKASQKVGDIMTVDFSVNFTQSQPRNAPLNIGEYFAKGTFPREYDVNRYRHLYKGEHGGLADGNMATNIVPFLVEDYGGASTKTTIGRPKQCSAQCSTSTFKPCLGCNCRLEARSTTMPLVANIKNLAVVMPTKEEATPCRIPKPRKKISMLEPTLTIKSTTIGRCMDSCAKSISTNTHSYIRKAPTAV